MVVKPAALMCGARRSCLILHLFPTARRIEVFNLVCLFCCSCLFANFFACTMNSVVSALTKRYGEQNDNYFSGSPLNRVSFLREDYAFLSSALRHPTTRFIVLQKFDPAVYPNSGDYYYLKYDDVKSAIGNPFEKSESEVIAEFDSSISAPPLIFLGIDESKADGVVHKQYTGHALFALDVTLPELDVLFKPAIQSIIDGIESGGGKFVTVRTAFILSYPDAAIYAQARSYLDWNVRNPFCAGCGSKTLSVNGGSKRVCPPTDRGVERGPCPSRGTITNISFPRTDPTIIVAVVNSKGDKLLLGRNKRFPVKFYSCLAGFCELGESVEEAVRREVWEESGVKLGRVVIHSTQPWPYPACLMIGAIAEALPDGEKIHLEHDPELGDAQWFPFSTVEQALNVAEKNSNTLDLTDNLVEGPIKVPPSKAIAHVLMRAVVVEKAHRI
ncbi:NUDIX hydrolase domain-like protein [Lipomyces japonicus]|uniref:NUDIX hydrolase domain-like protein n=1 Tax=Lipomyces japonicus TaxID=56871 RepID=UPI0034CE8652